MAERLKIVHLERLDDAIHVFAFAVVLFSLLRGEVIVERFFSVKRGPIKTIIERVEAYQASHASQKLEDFTIWLNTQLFASENSDPHAADNDLYIGFKLLYAAKELKRQSKGVLSESSLSSINEYSFLLHLNQGQTFRKMELIELHNLEAPTGIEVIKRLLKGGMIDEYPDEQDKRAKRVVITQRGIEELGHLGPQMDRVFSNASSPLSLNEKIQLSGALDKLIR